MPDYEALFDRLSTKAKHSFNYKWGQQPWLDPDRATAQNIRGWLRDLTRPPEYPRWDLSPEQRDPLYMALRAKNRRAARALLDKRTALTEEQTMESALLTLRWAPDLLERILEMGPAEPILYTSYTVYWQATGRTLNISGSLAAIAAGLDDLPSLKCLLDHGYPPDFQYQRDCRTIYRNYHRLFSRAHFSADFPGGRIIQFIPDANASQPHQRPYFSWTLEEADPLSTAIFCGAPRCTRYLLSLPGVQLSAAVRKALAYPYYFLESSGIRGIEEAKAVVSEMLGPLEELLSPEDFESTDSPLFLAVLKRHRSCSPKLVKKLLTYCRHGQDSYCKRQKQLLAALDPLFVSQALLELYFEHEKPAPLLALAKELHLPLDRCSVPHQLEKGQLLTLLEEFPALGPPPQEGLSGLAAAVLRQMESRDHSKSDTPLALLLNPHIAQLLQSEDRSMVLSYLAQDELIPAHIQSILYPILHIQKEVSYDELL